MTTHNDSKTIKLRHLETACCSQRVTLTTQRRVVLEALAERRDHPTADVLFEVVRERMPEMSRTTVYRVLETLVGIGVVQRVNSPLAKARFDADTKRHHHLVCLACDAVLDCHDPQLDNIQLPATAATGFEIRDYSVSFTGLCAECRDKSLDPRLPLNTNVGYDKQEKKEVKERNLVSPD